MCMLCCCQWSDILSTGISADSSCVYLCLLWMDTGQLEPLSAQFCLHWFKLPLPAEPSHLVCGYFQTLSSQMPCSKGKHYRVNTASCRPSSSAAINPHLTIYQMLVYLELQYINLYVHLQPRTLVLIEHHMFGWASQTTI